MIFLEQTYPYKDKHSVELVLKALEIPQKQVFFEFGQLTDSEFRILILKDVPFLFFVI